MLRNIILLYLLLACESVVSEKKQLKPHIYSVIVDGVAYGTFDVSGLEAFESQGVPKEYSVIKLSRYFITEPSLYLWAWKFKAIKTMPKIIYLEESLLLGCQPISWMIEVSVGGGYFENVDVTCIGYRN